VSDLPLIELGLEINQALAKISAGGQRSWIIQGLNRSGNIVLKPKRVQLEFEPAAAVVAPSVSSPASVSASANVQPDLALPDAADAVSASSGFRSASPPSAFCSVAPADAQSS
jgi:hypothetical protein